MIISDPCTACRGQGVTTGNKTIKVKIPAGVDDGSNIRLLGQGDAGLKGAKPGNLYLRLQVRYLQDLPFLVCRRWRSKSWARPPR